MESFGGRGDFPPAPPPDGGGHVASCQLICTDTQRKQCMQFPTERDAPAQIAPAANCTQRHPYEHQHFAGGCTGVSLTKYSSVCCHKVGRYLNRSVCSTGHYCAAFRAPLLRHIRHLMLRTQRTLVSLIKVYSFNLLKP